MPAAASSRFHYAWVVAAVTFATILIVSGVRSSSGMLVVPLESEFGWSRAVISLGIGISIFLHGAMGPFSASLMNRYGVRRMMLFALAMIGAGVAITPFMSSQPEESHLRLLPEPCMTLSSHTAPDVRPLP